VKNLIKTALATAGLALVAAPAVAAPPADGPGEMHRVAAPGFYCKNESKEHVEGMKRTPFAECVVAQARLRNGATSSPRQACRSESKRHVEGMSRTPFAECVMAGAKLLRDQDAE